LYRIGFKHGIYGCGAYGGHIADLIEKCEKYREWRVKKFGDISED